MNRSILLCVLALSLLLTGCNPNISPDTPSASPQPPVETVSTAGVEQEQEIAELNPETELLRQIFDDAAISELSDVNLTALYKAASSIYYCGGYWAMGYEGLDGYSASDAKRELINKILACWDDGSDPAADKLKEAVRSNKYFTEQFAESLMKTIYTYSYHAFAEEYGVWPNRTFEDVVNYQFIPGGDGEEYGAYYPAERYLKYEGCQFYEYDFDGDGEDEIGVPVHSGAGGMFQSDDFDIFKKNNAGYYELYSTGPACTLRDAMRIIRYEGKIYFLVNPYSDTGNEPHNIIAYTIDNNGNGHEMSLTCKDYQLTRVATYTGEAYSTGYDAFLSDAETQARNAVDATKLHEMYSPKDEKQFSYQTEDDWWEEYTDKIVNTQKYRQDIFFTADLYNDGSDKVIHKGHLITQAKYYDDYNWFWVSDSREGFDNGTVIVEKPVMNCGDHYGLHSDGNLSDIIPFDSSVVQFWTYEYNGVTYCMTLHDYTLLYTLSIYVIHEEEANLVSRSLFFDEAQGVDAILS